MSVIDGAAARIIGRLGGVVVVIGLAAAACGGEATPEEPVLLPPSEVADLAEIFDPIIEPLGYQVSRASLIDRATYQVDPEGDHLAVYVAPLSDISSDQIAADFPALVAAFLPFVFERWPELNSFDVCQEPFDSAAETPPSLTIIDLTRAGAGLVQWSDLDLAGIIALNDLEGISVWARSVVRESATWRAAAGP